MQTRQFCVQKACISAIFSQNNSKVADADLNVLKAQKQAAVVVPITRRRKRWIPYAAAACIAVCVAIIRLTRHDQPDNMLPVAKEVTVEGQTIHFLCNNGCSAQEVMLFANEVIK